MVLLTMIARVADGLPLAASVTEEDQGGRGLVEYQNQAKQLFRRMNQGSPNRGSLESGPYLFHYFIERGICYLTLCEQQFSKKLAFAYLEDLQQEFMNKYGTKVDTVARPYSFIEFDNYMQKAKKSFMDSRARKHLTSLNTELQDVQRIMVQNIDDVLQRGVALSALDDKANNLASLSQKYKKDAHTLNLSSSYAKIAAVVFAVVILLLLLRYIVF